MKKLLLAATLAFTLGCGDDDRVVLNDYKDQIDSNTARIVLLESQTALQGLEIDALDVRVTDLEGRMDQAELAIADNTDLVIDLTDQLSDEIDRLRDKLRRDVRSLRRADRQTRRSLVAGLSTLWFQLRREVRQLESADRNLQNQVDDLADRVSVLTSRFNSFRAQTNTSLFFIGLSIAILADQVDDRLDDLERDVALNASEIDQIQSDVSSLQLQMAQANSDIAQLQTDLDDVESRLVSVVYPCGEGNSEEVLLQTQDVLVAYFQRTRNKTLTFSDSITIPELVIPGHHDRFCVDTNFLNGECNDFDTRFVPGTTVAEQTYSVGDSASIKTIDRAYLDVLADGSYRTTDGFSCNFTISNGEVL